MTRNKCITIEMRPRYHEQRSERIYSESDVKKLLFAFARDIGCNWRADKLRKFIEVAFENN